MKCYNKRRADVGSEHMQHASYGSLGFPPLSSRLYLSQCMNMVNDNTVRAKTGDASHTHEYGTNYRILRPLVVKEKRCCDALQLVDCTDTRTFAGHSDAQQSIIAGHCFGSLLTTEQLHWAMLLKHWEPYP